MKIHTTEHGDQFLQAHITEATPWAETAYRPPARPLASDRAARFLTVSAIVASLLIILTIITALSV